MQGELLNRSASGWWTVLLYLICSVILLGCHLKGRSRVCHCVESAGRHSGLLSVFLRPMSNLFSGVPFPHVVLYKQAPSCHSPSGKSYHNCTNQNSPCLAGKHWNIWLIISFCQSSSSSASAQLSCTLFRYHDHWLLCDTAGTMTSFNIQVLWRKGMRGHKADRSEREREFIIQSLLRPAPATALHIPSQPVK